MKNNKSKIQNFLKPKTCCALKLKKSLWALLLLFISIGGISAQCTISLPSYPDGIVNSNGTANVTILPLVSVADCDTFSLSVFLDGNPVLINTTYTVGAGIHSVLYFMIDSAVPPNTVSNSVSFTMIDDLVPTAICHQSIVTLTNAPDGMAMVLASNMGAGSFDNVTAANDLVYEIKRSSDPVTGYGGILELTCGDQGMVLYDMRVTDEAGLSNVCSDTLFVNDKLAPVISCPADTLIQCEDYLSNNYNAQFGAATASDICGVVDLVELAAVVNISPCGDGTIFREWIATDPSGNADTCSQTIIIENQHNFSEADITWPDDYTVNDCQPSFDIEDLLPPYDKPTFLSSSCAMLGVSHSDSYFTSGYEGCSKIYRTWTVLNMCVYDGANPTNGGIWSHVQILTAMDTGDPVIMDCPDSTVVIGNYTADCGAQIATLATPAYDTLLECAPINLMEWHYSIMIYDDTAQEYVPYSQGEGVASDAFYNGLYKIDYTLSDPCGNTAGCWYMFEIKDLKKPTVGCMSGMAINIMQTGMISVTPQEFDYNSTDNCTATADLMFSFSSDVTDVLRTFTCADIGVNNVQMWVTDEAGNQEFCNVELDVQDNSGICTTSQMLSVSGLINLESGSPVEDVEVMLNTADYNMTDAEGNYNLEVASNTEYTMIPHRNTDIRNGVNTFDLVKIGRHILESELLDSPYKIIAADVNGSGDITGADVVILRQIILHNEDSFPNGIESWRFVDGHYAFIDPSFPFDEAFDESITFNIADDMNDANFIGIKVGDVTGDVQGTSEANEIAPRSSIQVGVKNHIFTSQEEVSVTLDLGDAEWIGGQMELKFDPEVLSFRKITSSIDGFSAGNVGLSYLDKGVLLLSWSSLSNINRHTVLTFEFNTLKAGALENTIQLSDTHLKSEMYKETGANSIQLNFENDVEILVFDEILNFPNPWHQYTNVVFLSDTQEIMGIKLLNVSGRVVYNQSFASKKGSNTFRLNNDGYSPGVYIIKIQGKEKQFIRKMIIN